MVILRNFQKHIPFPKNRYSQKRTSGFILPSLICYTHHIGSLHIFNLNIFCRIPRMSYSSSRIYYLVLCQKQLKYLNKKNLLLFSTFLQTKNEVCWEDEFHIKFFSFPCWCICYVSSRCFNVIILWFLLWSSRIFYKHRPLYKLRVIINSCILLLLRENFKLMYVRAKTLNNLFNKRQLF